MQREEFLEDANELLKMAYVCIPPVVKDLPHEHHLIPGHGRVGQRKRYTLLPGFWFTVPHRVHTRDRVSVLSG